MKRVLEALWQFCQYLFWPQRRPKDGIGSDNDVDLSNGVIIQKYQHFQGMKEDAVMKQCGYPDAILYDGGMSFCVVSESLVLCFLVEDDIKWINNPQKFSINYDYSLGGNQSSFVDSVYGKSVAVFVQKDRDYILYGKYKLENPYAEHGGLPKGAVEEYTPLVFSAE